MITNEYGIHTFSLKLQCKYSEIQNIIEQNECIRTGKGKLGLSSYYQMPQFKDIGVEVQLGQSVSHPCWLILIVNPSSLLASTYKPTALFQADKESVQQVKHRLRNILDKISVDRRLKEFKLSRCDLTCNLYYERKTDVQNRLDIFKKSFLEGFASTEITTLTVVTALGVACLLALYIFFVYRVVTRKTFYSKNFNITLAGVTVITASLILTMQSSVVLSLGMVGALSIVRFRTAIKDSRDTVYIFWSIIVGICCGVGDYAVACSGSAVTFAVILLLGCIKSDNRMLLIIRAHRSKQEPIKAQVYKLFRAKATLRVENTTEDTVELIYEITQKLLRRAEQTTPDIPGSIYSLGSIDYVNLVMQNDEVSN